MTTFTRTCHWCSASFVTEYETKEYCTRQHKERARQFRKNNRRTKPKVLEIRKCENCQGDYATKRANQRYCGPQCREYAREQMRRERDAEYLNQRTPAFRRRIYFKTEGMCGVCGEWIDLRLKFPNPKSYSIDHIVPRAAGGSHSYSNLQPAHLACNNAKGVAH